MLSSFILTTGRVLNGFICRWDLNRRLKMAGFEPTTAQKPGFFPNLLAIARLLVKTWFFGPSTLRTATQKPGFLENLRASTKDFVKNPVSRPLRKSKI